MSLKVSPSLQKQIIAIMHRNRRVSGKFGYTVPSPDSYPYQWFWDSCFHAIILSHFEIEAAKDELRALAHWQAKSGMIPHMIYWKKAVGSNFPVIKWGKRSVSSLIQPPLLAYAVWRVYQTDGDRSFLAQMQPAIHKLHSYLLRQRDPRRHFLIGLINPDESGEDNSPRFDKALHLGSRHTIDENYKRRLELVEHFRQGHFVVRSRMELSHWVRDVPINAIFCEDLRAEALIAEELGDISGARLALERAENVKKAMREYMLHGCLTYSTHGLDYKPIKIKTWAIFAPLFADILTPAEATDLVKKHLLNPKEFGLKYGVPTVAKSEPSFDPAGFWRGPTWMATNWFIYRGLIRYGFNEEAAEIARISHELLAKSGFREQYHPINGQGMGATNFTWGGLVLDMKAYDRRQ